MINLKLAQSYMKDHGIDAWLISDFRGNNPVMWQVLGKKKSTTRRSFLIIPSKRMPILLVHQVDKEQFSDFDLSIKNFVSWEEMHKKLASSLKGKKIAVEYSPKGEIPTMSWVDGGTMDLLRSLGMKLTSSSDLFQITTATWDNVMLNSHIRACKEVAEVKDMAFDFIRQNIYSNNNLNEYDVQQFILKQFQQRNLETEDNPIVAVNNNASNPHYEPSKDVHSEIHKGDWILIDLWARYSGENNVYSDITWVGYIGTKIPIEYEKIFQIVREARDLVIETVKNVWSKNKVMEGWELDMIARNYINKKGYGKYFVHRTGHSIGPGQFLHALGVNLDNLETHDTRKVLPRLGFSVEPGIYLPKFGVRLEINMFMGEKGPIVTTPIQNEIIRI